MDRAIFRRLRDQRIASFVGETMSDDRTARINTAVDAILEYCAEHGHAAMHQCVDELMLDKNWTVEDIRIVQVAVQKRLEDLQSGRGQ